LKLSRFAYNVTVLAPSGNIALWVHRDRARRLILEGKARLRDFYPSGSINEIILTNRLFYSPVKPKSWLNKRNLYSSPSSQDTNVARGTLRSLWVQAQRLHG